MKMLKIASFLKGDTQNRTEDIIQNAYFEVSQNFHVPRQGLHTSLRDDAVLTGP